MKSYTYSDCERYSIEAELFTYKRTLYKLLKKFIGNKKGLC